MHQFKIEPFFGSFTSAQYDIVFTNSALWTLIVLGIDRVFMCGGMKRSSFPAAGRWRPRA